MNKLMGFYELADLNIPSVPWREYKGTENLEPQYLWSVRSAVFRGDDLNLPRKIGVPAKEATEFADSLLSCMQNRGMVVYYPYFIADKSGTLDVYQNRVVIEAVKKDLWNMVTYSNRDVTVQIAGDKTTFNGDENFLSEVEIKELMSNVPEIKKVFRNELLEGKSVLLEWSYAWKSDLLNKPLGERYLVFFEVRTVV